MPPESLRNYAYATLMTRASYLAGVVILANTLRRQGSRYPPVVLYTTQLSADAGRALELEAPRQHPVLRRCEPLLPPAAAGQTTATPRPLPTGRPPTAPTRPPRGAHAADGAGPAAFKFPDQDSLAHFFRGRWHAVGWQYNALIAGYRGRAGVTNRW